MSKEFLEEEVIQNLVGNDPKDTLDEEGKEESLEEPTQERAADIDKGGKTQG